MAGSRTLKLSILADVDNLKKELDKGSKEVEGFSGKLEKFSAAAKAAFAAAAAAAAAYAVKLAVDGVKAAIEDEAAQERLANALKNVTGATNAQIAAIEEQILKTSLATGVADDQLRPAYQRLAVATGDLTKSSDLLTLALDISAATGKDVETVSNALGKAYEGNTGALTRLGVGLSAAEIKTLGLEGAITTLSDTFGGAAATQAETFQGKMARVQVAFDEAKETLGAALLPIIEKFFVFITTTAIPKLQEFKASAIDPVIEALKDNKQAFKAIYDFGVTLLVPFIKITLGNAIKGLATVANGIVTAVSIALKALQPIINAAIAGINAVIKAKNFLTGSNTPLVPQVNFATVANSTGSNKVNVASLPSGFTPSLKDMGLEAPDLPDVTVNGVTYPSYAAYQAAQKAPATAVPSVVTSSSGTSVGSSSSTKSNSLVASSGIVINVNSPSIIDEDGFTRAVIEALNNTQSRSGGGGSQLIL
jgi:hypothetical protein